MTAHERQRVDIRGRGERGEGYVWLLLLILGATLLTALAMEAYRDYSLAQAVENQLSRSANIAVSLSMLDAYRQEKIARLDPDTALREFQANAKSSLHTGGAYPVYRRDEDGLRFEIAFDSVEVTAEPPTIEARARLRLTPVVTGGWLPDVTFDIPIYIRTRNVRHDIE